MGVTVPLTWVLYGLWAKESSDYFLELVISKLNVFKERAQEGPSKTSSRQNSDSFRHSPGGAPRKQGVSGRSVKSLFKK